MSEVIRPAQAIFRGETFGKAGQKSSIVISCEIALMRESVVDMIAAREAVRAIYPSTMGNPPRPSNAPIMDVNGLAVCSLLRI